MKKMHIVFFEVKNKVSQTKRASNKDFVFDFQLSVLKIMLVLVLRSFCYVIYIKEIVSKFRTGSKNWKKEF